MTTLPPVEESALNRALVELLRLSPAARLEAVSRLVESVQQENSQEVSVPQTTKKTLADFVGLWADDADADAMEKAILKGRYSAPTPHLEDWD